MGLYPTSQALNFAAMPCGCGIVEAAKGGDWTWMMPSRLVGTLRIHPDCRLSAASHCGFDGRLVRFPSRAPEPTMSQLTLYGNFT
jgi:hypothetical protein